MFQHVLFVCPENGQGVNVIKLKNTVQKTTKKITKKHLFGSKLDFYNKIKQ
jgi:hypothetical protein